MILTVSLNVECVRRLEESMYGALSRFLPTHCTTFSHPPTYCDGPFSNVSRAKHHLSLIHIAYNSTNIVTYDNICVISSIIYCQQFKQTSSGLLDIWTSHHFFLFMPEGVSEPLPFLRLLKKDSGKTLAWPSSLGGGPSPIQCQSDTRTTQPL